MNEREKKLLIAVVAMAVLGLGYFGIQKASRGFAQRRAEITRIEGEIEAENVNVFAGRRAAEDMALLEERSLSDDREEAQRLYKAWLADWAERNDLEDVKFKVDSAREKVEEKRLIYRIHSFTIAGKTDLGKLTTMLYEFETAKQLHRMRTLNITPLGDKVLDVFITIDALAMPDAIDREDIPSDPELIAELGSLESAQRPIFERNLFGPANNAPQLGVRSSYSVNLGSTLTIDLSAKDKDEVDKLFYEANLDQLPGARLSNGKVEWRPRELGEYAAEFLVTDNGFPSLTESRKVTIKVVEPPPPRPPTPRPPAPKFNFANYTQLTAIIIKSGVPTAWLWVRPTDEQLKLTIGESFTIGEFKGEITELAYDHLIYESEGKIYRMKMRDFVGRAQLVGDAVQTVSKETPEADAGDDTPNEDGVEHLPPLESREQADAEATESGTTAEDATAEDATAEDATAEDATAEDATAEDATAEDATAEDATAEKASAEDAAESRDPAAAAEESEVEASAPAGVEK